MRKQNIVAKFAHKISILENKAASEIEPANWQNFIYCFAEVKPICNSRFSSIEGMDFGDIITEEYFQFKMRYVNGITKEMRIEFHDKIFEIKRIIDDQEKGRMLNIIGLEV